MQFLLLFLCLSSFSICKSIISDLLFFYVLLIILVYYLKVLDGLFQNNVMMMLNYFCITLRKRNKTHFDLATYQRFVKDDKKVKTKYFCLRCTLYFFILQRMSSTENQDSGFKAVFRSKVMCIVALNMSYQW